MKLGSTSFLVLLILALPFAASAQFDCTVGVYADAAGTKTSFQPTQGEPFNIYLVLFAEDFVNAVGTYEMDIPDQFDPVSNPGGDIIMIGNTFGPSGNGLKIDDDGQPGGLYNLGLGECAIGFQAVPIIVETFTLFIPGESMASRTISMVGTPETQYSTCQGVEKDCKIITPLFLATPVATESASFGAVKSLYGN